MIEIPELLFWLFLILALLHVLSDLLDTWLNWQFMRILLLSNKRSVSIKEFRKMFAAGYRFKLDIKEPS